MNPDKRNPAKKSPAFERLGDCLYWKGGKIVARVRVNGKSTWRSTETNEPAKARQWLKKWREEEWLLRSGIEPKGVVLHRSRVTVGELIDDYIKAGFPTRKMQKKSQSSITNEQACLRVLRTKLGNAPAASLTLADCDKYHDWRIAGGFFSDNSNKQRRKRFSRLKAGNRSVDLELTILSNVLNLAVRRGILDRNPLAGRSRYTHAAEIRHCREVAPTPITLPQIVDWLRSHEEHGTADLVCFLAYSGMRISEALRLEWKAVDRPSNVIHVCRNKRGILPWVPILPEMAQLLEQMQSRATGNLLFPSPFSAITPRDDSAVRHRLGRACRVLGLPHVTPHGLRSYFVTQAREAGLSEAEIAMLIGDKSGPAIIALTYGDVRPDHLLKQAQRIRLSVQYHGAEKGATNTQESSIKSSIVSPNVSQSIEVSQAAA